MPDEEQIQVEVGPDFSPRRVAEGDKPAQPLSAPAEIGSDASPAEETPPPELPDEELAPVENWWATIESEDDLRGHDRAKPWLDEAQDKARREIHSRLQPLINQRNNYLSEMTRNGQRFVKEIEKASREGMIGDDLLDRYEDTAGKMSGAYWHLGRFDGAKGMLLELSNALGDESLIEDFRPRIEILEQGGEDTKLFPELLKRLANTAAGKESESSEKKGYDKGVADGRKAAIEEIRARQRENQGPDLNRKQPSSGTVLTKERYQEMPGEERKKLSPAQIDAMTAELARSSR